MPAEITRFWSEFVQSVPPVGQLNIHPKDHDWFKGNGWTVHEQRSLTFDTFIRDNRFGKGAEDKELHLSLLPEPFIGNLESAEIYILLLNPGFSPSNYHAHENQPFRAALVSNLLQEKHNPDFPFFYLDPRFAWSSGFR